MTTRSNGGIMREAAAKRIVVFSLCAGLALSGCGGGSVTLQPPPQTPIISGDYNGSIQDSVLGSGSVTTTLTESGTGVSGTISIATKSGTIDQDVSWIASPNQVLNGKSTATIDGAACSFGWKGSYSTQTNVISGNYASVSGCSGETGTYTLQQQCTRPITAADVRRLPLRQPAPC